MFQEGGNVDTNQQPQDPMEQIVGMAIQAVQNNDPNLAMQVCETLVQIAQQAAKQTPTTKESAPAEGEPVFKNGGKLVRRIKK